MILQRPYSAPRKAPCPEAKLPGEMRFVFLQKAAAFAAGAILNNDEFQVRIVLIDDGPQCGLKVLVAIDGGSNDRDAWIRRACNRGSTGLWRQWLSLDRRHEQEAPAVNINFRCFHGTDGRIPAGAGRMPALPDGRRVRFTIPPFGRMAFPGKVSF